MKIVSTGSTLSSPQFLAKRRRVRRRRLTIWSVGLLIILVVVLILSRQEKFLISEVVVFGAKVVSNEAVVKKVQDLISGHYLYLVPKANALIYPGEKVEETLLKEFPRFKAVALSVEGLKLLRVEAAEREPFALYCLSPQPEQASDCYFLDDEGFIFDRAPLFSGAVYFVYGGSAGLLDSLNPLSQQYLPPNEFQALSKFIELLPTLKIIPQALEASDEEYSLVFARDSRVRWKRGEDFGLLYSNLEAFLNDDTIRNQLDFLEKVLELDLRTENKVFYRFRE